MRHILKCVCGSYTIKQVCPSCGSVAVKAGPAKFSPLDSYGAYRRAAKEDVLRRAGLL